MATTVRRAVESRIAEALVEFGADADALRPDATLAELDIDSLDLFELSQILKQEFGLEVDPEDFGGVETLGQAQAVLLGYVT
jgi:acyl carrier protein